MKKFILFSIGLLCILVDMYGGGLSVGVGAVLGYSPFIASPVRVQRVDNYAGTANARGRQRPVVDRAILSRLVDHADGPAPANGQLIPQVGNPGFIAQFDVLVIPKFFTVVVATGVWTASTAAAVAAAQPTLANPLPCFLFGNSDMSGGFARLRQLFPLTGWGYETAFIYGADSGPTVGVNTLDATAKAVLRVGDLVQPVFLTSGATMYVAFVINRCPQTAYGSLVDALNSDSFQINMIRQTMADSVAASLAQYANQIMPFNLSLFGKFSADQTSPNSFKIPEQQQQNIVDIPMVLMVDKQIALGMYLNYDVPTQMQLSFFVNHVIKAAR